VAAALMGDGARPVPGESFSSPLTRTVGVTSRTTGLPTFGGTWRLNRCFCGTPIKCPSIFDGDMADAGVGGNRKEFSGAGGSECARSTMGVKLPRFRSMGGPSLVFGLAGNVTKGPSRIERLLGGRPRSLPVDELLLVDHADETAGPCRRRDRDFTLEGVTADCGSSKNGYADCGVTAERG
jgi:hypothetical protein